MSQPPNLRGAIDLSSLGRPTTEGPGGPAGANVVDVSVANFSELVARSNEVPVLVYLYAARVPESLDFGTELARLVKENGHFVFARADVDTVPEIAQALQAQSVPTTYALLKGQPLPLFPGVPPADQVQQVLTQVVQVAAQQGVTGLPEGSQAEPPPEPPLPPHLAAAGERIDGGDLAGAAAILEDALKQAPADADAKAALAQVHLLQRLELLEATAVLARRGNETTPEQVAELADVLVGAGRTDEAYAALLQAIRTSTPEDKDFLRLRLLELFLLEESDSAAVSKARRDLAVALF